LRKDYGKCEDPSEPKKEIVVSLELDDQLELDTHIHEFLHACFWIVDEEIIGQAATDITKALWRLGYRKTEA
jgi:hypothetical protein